MKKLLLFILAISFNATVAQSGIPNYTITSMSSTVCTGGYVKITTTRTGDWGPSGFEKLHVNLYNYNTATNQYTFRQNLGEYSYSDNTVYVYIPTNINIGDYRFFISRPYNGVYSGMPTSTFSVVNSSCPPPPSATIQETRYGCLTNSSVTLTAIPNAHGYSYQWKKNGINISMEDFGNEPYHSPLTPGDYSVTITKPGYNSTSEVKTISNVYQEFTLDVSSLFFCGETTSSTLTSPITGSGYTYTWYKWNSGISSVIPEATGSSYIATSIGLYRVDINTGGCTIRSKYVRILGGPGAKLTNSDGTNNKVTVSPLSPTTNLKVELTGQAPWEVGLYDGKTVKTYYSETPLLNIPVSPTQLTRYSISYVSNACGLNSVTTGIVWVDSTPNASITFTTPATTTVCANNIINIPYTLTGNIGDNFNLEIGLSIYSNGAHSNMGYTRFNIDPLQSSGTIPLFIADIEPGFYDIFVNHSIKPTFNGQLLNYTVEVVDNIGCTPVPAPTVQGASAGCESTRLTASVYGYSSMMSYQWYKDGTLMQGKTGEEIIVYESGNYSVRVTRGTYDQTSALKSITISRVIPEVISTNTVICGSNTNVILSTPYTGADYTYQWYKDRNTHDGTTVQIPVFGQTDSSISVNSTGNYSVKVFDGSCLQNSKAATVDNHGNLVAGKSYAVTSVPTARLTNTSDNNDAITVAGGNPATIRVSFTGAGPWTFDLKGSDGNTTTYSANNSPANISVFPLVNTNYSIANFASACGPGTTSGNLSVQVSPLPDFTINGANTFSDVSFENTSGVICPGSTISVSYSTIGNWPATAEITMELVNAASGTTVSGTKKEGFITNPILYYIPTHVLPGLYKVKLTSVKPFIETPVIGNSTITIASASCSPPIATVRAKTNCSTSLLSAAPSGLGFTYEWHKNGIVINGETSEQLVATSNANYTVKISNTLTGFVSTSAPYILSVNEINRTITSTGTNCGEENSVTLTSQNTQTGYIHQWYFSGDNVFFQPIAGATLPTHTSTIKGYYYVLIKSEDCEQKSNIINTCLLTINFASKSVCRNSSVQVPFSFGGGEGYQFNFQLINSVTNAVVANNLKQISSSKESDYMPTVSLPVAIPEGSYKFRILSESPQNLSYTSSGILTITNQTGGTPPAVTSSISNVSSAQNVSISAIGCLGDVVWNNSDGVSQSFPLFSSLVNKTTTYTAVCVDYGTSCVSLPGSTTVTFSCTDTYEPNDNSSFATSISSNNFLSPVICLNGYENPDWFKWVSNGHSYYIKASLNSLLDAGGNYKLRLNYTGSILTVETHPELTGGSLNTYLTLYDSDGTTVLAQNDNGGTNGFSKITFTILNPCPSEITLSTHTGDDINSGIEIKQTHNVNGIITAANKITGNANVTYMAGKSIILDPGFKADSGTIFKTEIGGCN